MTRDRYHAWQAKGSKDIGHRIRDEIKVILETHKVSPLSEKVLQALQEIKQTGNRELAGK
jgi:trimethylamine:corrinoid methyltransferase-like protein